MTSPSPISVDTRFGTRVNARVGAHLRANVVGYLALAVATSGTAYAAPALAKNSVRTAQIVNGQVKTADLGASAVTGAKVKNNTLTGAVINEATLKHPPVTAAPAAARVFAGEPVQAAVTLTGAPQTVATVSFTAPADGFVTVLAQATFTAGEAGTFLEAVVKDNGTVMGGSYWDAGDADAAVDQSQFLAVTRPITKGAHVVGLTLREGSVAATYSKSYLPSVTVQFFPLGVTGAVQIPD